uniref:Helitron helicase-like domain-containing protein n=1 Tax=Nicotiana tabacum TaxID=4097 RepID=A0A1S4DN93_TOBAC|nr:PREDICTED: uncharacterized protein LOC107831602 [Nicotiana tabacum]
MGGKVDASVNQTKGPRTFKLSGQNYHQIGSLLPPEGSTPKFAQLYIYDTENEVQNRLHALGRGDRINELHAEIVQDLKQMLDDHNVLTKSFRMVRDKFHEHSQSNVRLRLIGKRNYDGRRYNLPTVSEVAALVVGDFDVSRCDRDIIVETQSGHLQRINGLNAAYLVLQYPLLFPFGEDGYREDIPLNGNDESSGGRNFVSIREYLAYKIQERNGELPTILNSRRLFQQFLVDGFTMVESSRLKFFRTHQKQLRAHMYKGLEEAVLQGEINPSSQVIYTVEFQKRGLPHAHILLFLHNKYPNVGDIDQIISAEIPDKSVDPHYYMAVKNFMMHGPCGSAKKSSPCMRNGRCTKHFPKKFVQNTTIDEDGYLVYQRKDDNRTITKEGIELDNRYVVPHNRYLLLKYGAHINVEWCNQSRSIKYLFKYVNKGNDRVTAAFSQSVHEEDSQAIDEIKMYYDCRYISPCEAAWRIFKFPIQHREPSVERLSFHLPNEQTVIFSDDDPIDEVTNRPSVKESKFLSWFEANNTYDEARELTYAEFPLKFVWNVKLKKWEKRRNSAFSIGRILFVPPGSGEQYYLRMLLNVIKGPKSYADLRKINNQQHLTFRDACYALGLLDDDKEYIDAIKCHDPKSRS